jgi:hypothetical protein
MAELPGSGYISTGTRTEAEVQTALEQLHDVIAEIGSKAPTVLTISGNTISTAPLASMILVRSEGHASSASDSLNSIDTTNITQGRLVILKNNDGTSTTSSGQTITINHGVSAGNVTLTEGTGTFILCAQRMLAVIYSGDRWIEVWRSYGRANSEDQLDERTSLGLGTASVEAIATGSGASANSTVLKVAAGANIATSALLAIDASGNITTGSVTGGNADTLDNLDSPSFVRTDATSPQSIDANLTSTTTGATRIVTDTTGVSQTAGFSMQDGGIERGLLYLDTSDGDVYLKTSDAASAPQAAIKIDAATGKLEYSSQLGTDPLQSLTPGAGNGLNADLLDGIHAAEMLQYNGTFSSSSSGSFKISAGSTNLLVQWGGTWANVGDANSGGRVRLTFPIAFTSTPHIIGGGYAETTYLTIGGEHQGLVLVGHRQPLTVTSTYIDITRGYTGGGSNFTTYRFSSVGNYLAIGTIA